MLHLILGSLLLSMIHAAIPSHWLPLVAISKGENWPLEETLLATAITGFAHTFSTVMLGLMIGWAGVELSESFESFSYIFVPVVLITLGAIFIVYNFRNVGHSHVRFQLNTKSRSKWTIILSLSIAMFFSPCLEMQTIYLDAGTHGWEGILVISVIYSVVTVMGMLFLVYLGFKGLRHINFYFFQRHEKAITGFVLVILGILSFLFRH